MTESVAAQAIVTGGTITVALITVGIPAWLKLRGIASDAREAREQTTNEHPTNFRDDLDAVAERLDEGFAQLAAGQRRHDAEIGGIRADIRQTRQQVTDLTVEVRRSDARLDEDADVIAWARREMTKPD